MTGIEKNTASKHRVAVVGLWPHFHEGSNQSVTVFVILTWGKGWDRGFENGKNKSASKEENFKPEGGTYPATCQKKMPESAGSEDEPWAQRSGEWKLIQQSEKHSPRTPAGVNLKEEDRGLVLMCRIGSTRKAGHI